LFRHAVLFQIKLGKKQTHT